MTTYKGLDVNRLSNNKRIFSGFILCASMLSLPHVQASWLDQGAELFKSFQESQTDSDKSTPASLSNLSSTDIEKAFKEALSKGTQTVVGQLGVKDGFNADPKIHIPLPNTLQKVQSTLVQFGMGDYMDDVEVKLNRAAEAATPEAKALFIDAIKEMNFEDIQQIYKGPEDSATQYLK